MELNLNIESVIFGESIPETNTGKILSVALMHVENTDGFTAKKLEGWAGKLRKGEPLTLDEADKGLLKQFIDSPNLSIKPFIRNQINSLIDELGKFQ